MEKIIKVEDREVRLKVTAATLIHYRREFNRDPLQDLIKLSKLEDDITQIDLTLFYNFFYIMAKSGDNSINNMDEFLDQFEIMPLEEIIPIVIDFLEKSFGSIKKK